jgi:hypothetical protein
VHGKLQISEDRAVGSDTRKIDGGEVYHAITPRFRPRLGGKDKMAHRAPAPLRHQPDEKGSDAEILDLKPIVVEERRFSGSDQKKFL